MEGLGLDRVEAHHDVAGLADRFRRGQGDLQHMLLWNARDISEEQFRDAVDENIPVVLRGACDDMPAMTLWQEDAYLLDRVGHARLMARTAPSDGAVFGDAARLAGQSRAQLYEFAEVSAAELLKELSTSTKPAFYGARIELQEDLPELVPDIHTHYELRWRHAFGRPYRGGVITYIGAGMQSTPLHFDDYENLVLVIRGSKEVTLFPPSQSAHLYPVPHALGTMYSQVPREALSACQISRDAAQDDAADLTHLSSRAGSDPNEAVAERAGDSPAPDDGTKGQQKAADEPCARSLSAESAATTPAAAEALQAGVSECAGSETDGGAQTQKRCPRFPLLQRARGFKCNVRGGDMLYIPVGWWHSVRGSPEVNLTLNYWFAQSPTKQDASRYRQSLEQSSKKWLRQLESMGLPESIMRDAREEAPQLVESKLAARTNFSWT